MPISIRLPADIEAQIASFSARQGVSKSALIVRSIKEFLAQHAQPGAYQIYLDEMQKAQGAASSDATAKTPEQRGTKLTARAAMVRKHAERSTRAQLALKSSAKKPPRAAT